MRVRPATAVSLESLSGPRRGRCEPSVQAGMATTVELRVEMMCGGCSGAVERVLKKMAGAWGDACGGGLPAPWAPGECPKPRRRPLRTADLAPQTPPRKRVRPSCLREVLAAAGRLWLETHPPRALHEDDPASGAVATADSIAAGRSHLASHTRGLAAALDEMQVVRFLSALAS